MKSLYSVARASLMVLVLMTILLGGAYPFLVTVMARVAFPSQSQGSLIDLKGKVVGSRLLGQAFTGDRYFWSRLSATSPAYNAASSGGSNLSPANPKLLDAANRRMADLQKADSKNKNRIPVDLVTASASGLDPHISLAAAEYQLPRVAKARHMSEQAVRAIMQRYSDTPVLGFWGEPKVNVLMLNLALDGKE